MPVLTHLSRLSGNGLGIPVPLSLEATHFIETENREYFCLNTELPTDEYVVAIEYFLTSPGQVEFLVRKDHFGVKSSILVCSD